MSIMEQFIHPDICSTKMAELALAVQESRNLENHIFKKAKRSGDCIKNTRE